MDPVVAMTIQEHWCPVKYFSDLNKSLAINSIADVWPKNDLN
jgi:hypothetical protein